jgi:uncharacterized membrane protein
MPDDTSTLPDHTIYHRWIGWHAPALRRFVVALCLGAVVAVLLALVATWEVAVLAGWDAAAVSVLLAVRPMLAQADGDQTQHLAMRVDETQSTARLLVLLASVASLFSVAFVLGQAGEESGSERLLLITLATFTVVVSWTLVNTVFTLRYAHLYFSGSTEAIEFGQPEDDPRPDYRDFAYLAFTIGMTYQVSDTTLRDRGLRRTVLVHAILSYVFGVAIVAAGINLIAGLVQ